MADLSVPQAFVGQVILGLHAATCTLGAFAAIFVLQARTASACLASPLGRRRWLARGLLVLVALGLFAEGIASLAGDGPPSLGEALIDVSVTTALVWVALQRRRWSRATRARFARVAESPST